MNNFEKIRATIGADKLAAIETGCKFRVVGRINAMSPAQSQAFLEDLSKGLYIDESDPDTADAFHLLAMLGLNDLLKTVRVR